MTSLTDRRKKCMLELLQKEYNKLKVLERKKFLQDQQITLKKLYDHRVLLEHYRRFVSPRKVVGKLIDKIKNKFYYESEYFIGDVVARQERFNNELIDYLRSLEKEIQLLKKENSALKHKKKLTK